MSICIVIVCLILQRLLGINYFVYQLQWLRAYFHWIITTVEYVTEGHAAIALLILLMPLIIVSTLFFSLIYHFLGVIVFGVVNFILVWVCIDGRRIMNRELFIISYERLFAVVFWFVIFGPGGLILYTSVIVLRDLFTIKHENLLFYTLRLKAILDWVPIRLVGFSYALVGHFSSVAKLWQTHLQTGLQGDDTHLVVEYGCAALGVHENALDKMQPEMADLVDRALILWLLCVGVLTILFWLA